MACHLWMIIMHDYNALRIVTYTVIHMGVPSADDSTNQFRRGAIGGSRMRCKRRCSQSW